MSHEPPTHPDARCKIPRPPGKTTEAHRHREVTGSTGVGDLRPPDRRGAGGHGRPELMPSAGLGLRAWGSPRAVPYMPSSPQAPTPSGPGASGGSSIQYPGGRGISHLVSCISYLAGGGVRPPAGRLSPP